MPTPKKPKPTPTPKPKPIKDKTDKFAKAHDRYTESLFLPETPKNDKAVGSRKKAADMAAKELSNAKKKAGMSGNVTAPYTGPNAPKGKRYWAGGTGK
jgi:hypothetical protein